jgi:predicted dehydrogenase
MIQQPSKCDGGVVAALRFGLVGCGAHGRAAVIPAFERSTHARLAAVADASPANLGAWCGQAGRYSSVEEMIRSEPLDAVYVATNAGAHAEVAIRALNAGLHVITEKPMACSVAECRAMIAAAESAGKTLAVDFESRCMPHNRQIRQWIAEGRLGRVRAVHLDHLWDGHKTSGPLSRRREAFLNCSGCLDCGIHQIDLVRYFCGGGEWKTIHAAGAWFGEDVRFPPHISILATLDSGVLATINASFAFTAYIPKRTQDPNFSNLAIAGDQGVIVFHHDALGRSEMEIVSASLCAIMPLERGSHNVDIAEVLDGFSCAVRSGTALPPEIAGGYDGLMSQICADEANRQALSYRPPSQVGQSCPTAG